MQQEPDARNVEAALLGAIDESTPALRETYRGIYRRLLEDFGMQSFERWRPAGKAMKAPEWIEQLLDRILRVVGERISLVQGTVKETIRQVLRGETMMTALREGWSLDRLVRLLRPELEAVHPAYEARYMVERIARTEVVAGSNYATQAGAQQAVTAFGIQLEKVWISSDDERTRRQPRDEYDHRAINEQRRDMSRPFDVPSPLGTVPLDYPGDPSGPPGAVINCRCALAHQPRPA